jgi:hypothetical protein
MTTQPKHAVMQWFSNRMNLHERIYCKNLESPTDEMKFQDGLGALHAHDERVWLVRGRPCMPSTSCVHQQQSTESTPASAATPDQVQARHWGAVWCPARDRARLPACRDRQFGCLHLPPSQAPRVQISLRSQALEERSNRPSLSSLAGWVLLFLSWWWY